MEYSWSIDTYQLKPKRRCQYMNWLPLSMSGVKPLSASIPAVSLTIHSYSLSFADVRFVSRFHPEAPSYTAVLNLAPFLFHPRLEVMTL